MDFRYIATDKQGKRITATTKAENMSALVMRLKSEGLLPLNIYEAKPTRSNFLTSFISGGRVKSKDVVIFTRQLAATLSAGLLLTEALETIAEDMENIYFRNVIRRIREDILTGSNFSQGLAKHPKIFPVTYVAIIRSGEATGSLDKTLTHLARYLENSERLREKVKTALRYPTFVLSFAIFVVLVIVIFLIPKFTAIFEGFHAQLPLITRIVVGISNFVLHKTPFAIAVIFVVWIAFIFLMKIPAFRFQMDVLKLKIPVLGKDVIHKSKVSAFCRTLGTLMNGGVALPAALEISAHVVDHLMIGQAVDRIRTRVIAGASMGEEIRSQSRAFPKLVGKMVSVGERTGRVDDMLIRTADYYDDELENTLQTLMSLLEPILIIFIGSIVLVVILALYLPIFKLSAIIK